MNAWDRKALERLREIRDALGEEDAPRRVDLRDYAVQGSAEWTAYVASCGVPGHGVRRSTMLSRINKAVDDLTAQALGTDVSGREPPGQRQYGMQRGFIDTDQEQARTERHPLRRLSRDGVEYARQFLAGLRQDPAGSIQPPDDLLFDAQYSPAFVGDLTVQQRSFRTRREAAEYFSPLLRPIAHLAADSAGLWSWLGMYYFPRTVPRGDGAVKLSPIDETFVVGTRDVASHSYQLRYRHYLWGSWRLYEQHGEDAAYLLDENLARWSDIADRCFRTMRVFNSIGVVPLITRLYTDGPAQKRGIRYGRGGIRHLFRVLDQLERTYDVYGMEPDALITILPPEFKAWDGGPGPDR